MSLVEPYVPPALSAPQCIFKGTNNEGPTEKEQIESFKRRDALLGVNRTFDYSLLPDCKEVYEKISEALKRHRKEYDDRIAMKN